MKPLIHRQWVGALALLLLMAPARGVFAAEGANPPIHIAFLWHLHQPIYWPYETVVETEDAHRYSFSVLDVHLQRIGPYTAWPMDAVAAGMNAGLAHLGAQVSLSGSLIENLNEIERAGRGFANWKARWREAMSWKTVRNHPRIDLVAFGYHHPLMGLIPPEEIGRQIALHRKMLEENFGREAAASKGFFPPETAFSSRMIPALLDAGIEWVIIDSIHLERAHQDYPYTPASNLYPPNPADQRNDAPTAWVQLTNIWAPSKVAAPFAYRPHYAAHTDPETGITRKIIVVPAARYEGNEDARGGFGALQYEQVMSQYEAYNTDPRHPMLVVLHHDGDNFGGGSDAYYHSNFDDFIAWLQANPDRFVCTTIQDYLDMFPPEPDDVVHVEDGSWAGADNGDPEFLKWNGPPDETGYSPDRNSWSVITAARNRVMTAEEIRPAGSILDILTGGGNETAKAWHFFLNGEASDYWYWDGAENGIWDSNPTRAANESVVHADRVIGVRDLVPPSIYTPQREPYNPGGIEWGDEPMPSDFEVWTYVDDLSGLRSVRLLYRSDPDGRVDRENERYAGLDWHAVPMTASTIPPRTDPLPRYQAARYEARITGFSDVLIDYYVEATDTKGNTARSPIRHVFVGQRAGDGEQRWEPPEPTTSDVITIFAPAPGNLHWGVNGWQRPDEAYWPPQTVDWGDGAAVESPLAGPREDGTYSVAIGPFDRPEQAVAEVDFVFHFADGSWSSPDETIPIRPVVGTPPEVEITAPHDGDTVRGTIEIVARAEDPDGRVIRVEFLADGEVIGEDLTPPWSIEWDTSSLERGSEHTLRARAHDNDENRGTSPAVTVTVADGPIGCGMVPGRTKLSLLLLLLPLLPLLPWRRDRQHRVTQ